MIEPEGSGLTVSPSSLTFSSSSLGPQFITVDTTTDSTYTGDRSATLTLTADDYATTMVIVTILENTPQTITLEGVPTELSLVRFTRTMIGVRVDIDADLTVKAEGAVILVGAVPTSLTGSAEAIQIQIEGERVGEGTVTFTVSGARKATATAVVSVTVTRPKLVISEISPSNINLLTRETTVVTVSVSAIGNHDSTLTAMVTGIGNSVTPTKITNVPAGTATTFTVTAGLAAGDETLTLTASHPDYDSTSTKVDVRVDLRSLELSVEPSPLMIVTEMSAILTIEVQTTATITISSSNTEIARVGPVAPFTLGERSSTEINIRGGNIGDTTLTIEATADGYAAETRLVNVMVLDRFRIEARPPTLDLAEGSTYAISVNLSRIEADRDVTVTVTIMNPLEGSGLTLSTSLLTFTEMGLQTVTVISESDDKYTGDRSATLTLTARGYAMAMVMIDIIENTPQSIKLEGVPTELSLVRFTSTMIGVSVDIDADLTVKAEGAVRLVRAVPPNLTGGAEATQIQIQGESVGEGTVTFTVSGVRKATATAVVRCYREYDRH